MEEPIISAPEKEAGKIKKYLKNILSKKGFYCKAVFAVVAIAAVVVTSLYTGVIIAYNVVYNGKTIALVRDKSDYEKAMAVAQNVVGCESIRDYAYAPEFSVTITVADNITNTDTLAQNIIEQTETIDQADAVFVNDEFVACVSVDAQLSAFITEKLNENNPEEGECLTEFVDNVKVVSGYYPVEQFSTNENVWEQLKDLTVKTTVVLRTQKTVPFKVISRKSDTRYIGDVVKIVNGQEGIEETVEHIVYINGEEVSREVVETVVIKEAVDEITAIGTLPRVVDTNTAVQVGALGLIWPLQRTSNQIITAYWGDGRNHKAIDIASPSGTPIYAAQAGRVITSTYIGSYGNYIIIDHGNGYQTCYAHASRLYVSAGETVAQGQVIAAVGTTGQSTGNHLHFEVRVNGVKVDPAPFLGLY